MKRFLAALLGLAAGAALATTVNIPLIVTVTPTQTTITVAGQTTVIPVPTTPVPPIPPSSGTFWVYQNGVFNWGGDYSFPGGKIALNYQDTAGAPAAGKYDLSVQQTAQWAGWLPWAGKTVPQWAMDVSGYKTLAFDTKATVAGEKWSVYFVKVGDVPLPSSCGQLVPSTSVGKWETHLLSLASLCIGPGLVGGTVIYKFAIQDQSGLTTNTWFVNNVGFVP